jgi:hypothetical protein
VEHAVVKILRLRCRLCGKPLADAKSHYALAGRLYNGLLPHPKPGVHLSVHEHGGRDRTYTLTCTCGRPAEITASRRRLFGRELPEELSGGAGECRRDPFLRHMEPRLRTSERWFRWFHI